MAIWETNPLIAALDQLPLYQELWTTAAAKTSQPKPKPPTNLCSTRYRASQDGDAFSYSSVSVSASSSPLSDGHLDYGHSNLHHFARFRFAREHSLGYSGLSTLVFGLCRDICPSQRLYRTAVRGDSRFYSLRRLFAGVRNVNLLILFRTLQGDRWRGAVCISADSSYLIEISTAKMVILSEPRR